MIDPSMSDFLATLLDQTAGLRGPIEGDAPAGVDLALEPEFERIKNELEKLTNLAGGDVDWRVVVDGAEGLLGGKTKDIRLAVWLTAGGAELRGWHGLARGLAVLRAYVTDLWEHAFPKRDKARTNILVWLGERAAPIVEKLDVRLEDADVVNACAELADEIDRAAADKLGDAFPGMRGLVQGTKARVRDIPEPPPPPEEKPAAAPVASEWADDDDDDAPPPSSEPAPSSGARPAATTESVALSARPEDAEATVRTCSEALMALARGMIAQDPTRAWAYRLHLVGAWLPIERVQADAGVVSDPGPSAELRALLSDLFTAARWHELVVAAAEASAKHPLWLDAQRFAAIALERMGTAYAPAREAAGREAADFARRNGSVVQARFGDGTAVATPETIAWLQDEVRRWKLRSAQAADVIRAEDEAQQRRLAEAQALVAAGHHAEGLAIAVQLARRGSDTRERFQSSLDVADLAMNAGAHDVARPILEALVPLVERHDLETWDPSLCAKLYSGLYACLPADAEARPKIFETLCRLDPSAALRARFPAPNGHDRQTPQLSRTLPAANGTTAAAPHGGGDSYRERERESAPSPQEDTSSDWD